MAVIVEERPGWRGRRREAFPEAVRCWAGNTMHGGMKNDPSEFAGAKPRIEPLESLEFVHDRVGHPELAVRREDLPGVGHEPEHALLVKTAFEAAYRFRMGPGFLRPLCRSALRREEQRADEFIPILRGIEQPQLGVVRIGMGQHW